MNATEHNRLSRENDYLKARCAELQGDICDLTSEVRRLEQRLEHVAARRTATPPNPLAGGQA